MERAIDPATYLIKPRHINTVVAFLGFFDRAETAIAARQIVRFCQQRRKGWAPFTLAALNQFCQVQEPAVQFWLSGLDAYGYVVSKNGSYHLTHKFVATCFLASPALRPATSLA